MKQLFVAVLFAFITALSAIAQATACGVAPTPGKPNVCMSFNPVTKDVNGNTITGVTYNIFRATTTGAENYGTPLNPTPLTNPFFYDTTVTVGTTYYYTAVAGSGGKMSAPSTEVSTQVPVPDSAPTSPLAASD
jgi:hypothetical protein